MIAAYDHEVTVENWALGWRWDIVLRGGLRLRWTKVSIDGEPLLMTRLGQTPSQTVGPYFSMVLGDRTSWFGPTSAARGIRIEGRVVDGDGGTIEDALDRNLAGQRRRPIPPRGRRPARIDLDDGFTGFGRAETDFSTGLTGLRR